LPQTLWPNTIHNKKPISTQIAVHSNNDPQSPLVRLIISFSFTLYYRTPRSILYSCHYAPVYLRPSAHYRLRWTTPPQQLYHRCVQLLDAIITQIHAWGNPCRAA